MAVVDHRYRVILADPPWKFNNRREFRRDNPSKKAKSGVGAAGKYRRGVMSTEDIMALGPRVQRLSSPDAYLFLWVCESMQPDAAAVLGAWGFRLINTAFTWLKLNPSGSPFFGTGKYTAGATERCLLARREKSRLPCWHSTQKGAYKPSQAVLAPHPRTGSGKIIHSRKPSEVQERLERWLDPYLAGHGKLELFATQYRPGWTCLGDELSGRDLADDLDDLIELLEAA